MVSMGHYVHTMIVMFDNGYQSGICLSMNLRRGGRTFTSAIVVEPVPTEALEWGKIIMSSWNEETIRSEPVSKVSMIVVVMGICVWV